jgi:hypothetical protein
LTVSLLFAPAAKALNPERLPRSGLGSEQPILFFDGLPTHAFVGHAHHRVRYTIGFLLVDIPRLAHLEFSLQTKSLLPGTVFALAGQTGRTTAGALALEQTGARGLES